MLHEFLADNRAELIDRCGLKVAQRPSPRPTHAELEYGIPLFLDQLVKTLRMEQTSSPTSGGISSEIAVAAARHGLELLQHGFTIDQVVHDYGDLCQAVTDLAFERSSPIRIDEFRTLNRCLDDAIADAVSEFARQRDRLAAEKDRQALNERLGFLAHELRNLVQTATLAVTAIKAGNVGLAGATGSVLDRSLVGLRNLIDRSLADVRVMAGTPARPVLIALPEFIGKLQVCAALEARARGCRFTVSATGVGLAILGDRETLSAAVGDLLRNAIQFTDRDADVSLSAYSSDDRVLIDVATDKSGLALGLSICRSSVEANNGILRVRDVPGAGCVFTIDLPRHAFCPPANDRPLLSAASRPGW